MSLLQASTFEFRLRMVINAAIIVVGFVCPWIAWWGMGSRISTLEWLALELSRSGVLGFTVAVHALIVAAVLIAALGALLRISGTAYLGTGTVNRSDMEAGRVIAAGPYRWLRNPLYVGLWCMVAVLGFLMPVSGAAVALVLITLFLFRLILAEEAFLKAQLGEAYEEYCRKVPRLIPGRCIGTEQGRAVSPQWLRAGLAELTPVGVFVALAFLGWRYDSQLMIRTILVFFGMSLVTRALLPASTRS